MGGVLGLVLIAAAIWFLLRRKRSQRTQDKAMHDQWTELQNTERKEISREPSELVDHHGVSELGEGQKKNDTRPSEMWAPHPASELAG